MQNINEIIARIIELPTEGFFFGLKIFFIVLSLLLTAGIIYFLLITDWYEKRFGADFAALSGDKPRRESKIARTFKKAKKRLEKPGQAQYKLALLEAAALLEKILAKQGFKGKTLLEQLEAAGPDILPPEALKELLKAYEVLSNVAYDPDYKLTLEKAQKTLKVFERIVQELTGS